MLPLLREDVFQKCFIKARTQFVSEVKPLLVENPKSEPRVFFPYLSCPITFINQHFDITYIKIYLPHKYIDKDNQTQWKQKKEDTPLLDLHSPFISDILGCSHGVLPSFLYPQQQSCHTG